MRQSVLFFVILHALNAFCVQASSASSRFPEGSTGSLILFGKKRFGVRTSREHTGSYTACRPSAVHIPDLDDKDSVSKKPDQTQVDFKRDNPEIFKERDKKYRAWLKEQMEEEYCVQRAAFKHAKGRDVREPLLHKDKSKKDSHCCTIS